MADITTLYRGEPWWGKTTRALEAIKELPTLAKIAGLSLADLDRLGGKWWTADPAKAGEYGSQIKSLKLKPGDIEKINKFGQKVTDLPSGKYRFSGLGTPIGSQNQYLLPESILKNRPSNINTSAIFKNLGSKGLSFLKANALKSLGYLGSLPASAALMTLSPTKLGSAEIDIGKMDQQRAQATSAKDRQNIQKIQQHTGRPLSDYRMSRPASERRHTGHGKSGMGRDRSELMATGGIVDAPLPGRSRYI